MPMTDDEIRALLEGCKGVTPGPWETYYNGLSVCNDSGHIAGCEEESDAAHIARCDPQTIAELCIETLSLRARVKVLEEALRWYGEQARLAKLIHAEGDLGRHRLAKDGGERARAALQEQSK